MHYRIIILLLFSTHFVYLSLEGQGGWVRQKKSLFLKTDVSSLEAENFYNVTGSKLKTNAFKQNTIGIYGEYGIHDRFTILLNAPILRINSFETTEKVFGMGDPRIGIKYRLTPADKLPIAISIEPELPLGRKNAFAKNLDNKNDIINLPTGDGEFNIWSTLALSIPLSSRLYVSGYGAYNMRTTFEGEKFRNLYQIGGEIGFSPLKDMWMNAKIRGQFSQGESISPNLSFIRGDATTYTLVSFEVFYKFLNQYGLSITYLSGNEWLAPFRNAYIAPFYSIGIIYEH